MNDKRRFNQIRKRKSIKKRGHPHKMPLLNYSIKQQLPKPPLEGLLIQFQNYFFRHLTRIAGVQTSAMAEAARRGKSSSFYTEFRQVLGGCRP